MTLASRGFFGGGQCLGQCLAVRYKVHQKQSKDRDLMQNTCIQGKLSFYVARVQLFIVKENNIFDNYLCARVCHEQD